MGRPASLRPSPAPKPRPGVEVILLEKGPQFLSKVRISGGGRCNVTHACFEPREFAAHYPRGERELIGPFNGFQASDTVAWFESRGVKLKTERDGRMFPTTDSSQTIIDCLLGAAKAAGVKLHLNSGRRSRDEAPGRRIRIEAVQTVKRSTAIGCSWRRADAARRLWDSWRFRSATRWSRPCRRLFTFHIETPWLRELAGVSVEPVEASVPGTSLRERGALLLTHWGLSGPAILRLSAWGARELHGLDYRFPLRAELAAAPERGSARGRASVAPQGPARALRREHAAGAADAPASGNGSSWRRAFRATRAGPRFPGRRGTSLSSNCSAPNCR